MAHISATVGFDDDRIEVLLFGQVVYTDYGVPGSGHYVVTDVELDSIKVCGIDLTEKLPESVLGEYMEVAREVAEEKDLWQ